MRLFYLSMFVELFLCGCAVKNKDNSYNDNFELTDERIDIHTPRNSTNYQGTYKGTFPTDCGSGMEVTVMISDNTYHKTTRHNGIKKEFRESVGTYTWNDRGDVITLLQDEKPNSYLVTENELCHLDKDGNRFTGELAEMYILQKE